MTTRIYECERMVTHRPRWPSVDGPRSASGVTIAILLSLVILPAANLNSPRFGMLADIVQGLLNDTDQLSLHHGRIFDRQLKFGQVHF